MTASEFAGMMIDELKSAGHKNVVLKEITPCDISFQRGFRSVSMMLFDSKKIPDSAEVTPTFTASETEQPAAMFRISHVPPRCRKAQDKTYYAALV